MRQGVVQDGCAVNSGNPGADRWGQEAEVEVGITGVVVMCMKASKPIDVSVTGPAHSCYGCHMRHTQPEGAPKGAAASRPACVASHTTGQVLLWRA